jgi:hypothetical protein
MVDDGQGEILEVDPEVILRPIARPRGCDPRNRADAAGGWFTYREERILVFERVEVIKGCRGWK